MKKILKTLLRTCTFITLITSLLLMLICVCMSNHYDKEILVRGTIINKYIVPNYIQHSKGNSYLRGTVAFIAVDTDKFGVREREVDNIYYYSHNIGDCYSYLSLQSELGSTSERSKFYDQLLAWFILLSILSSIVWLLFYL